jgi:hypothetical protein
MGASECRFFKGQCMVWLFVMLLMFIAGNTVAQETGVIEGRLVNKDGRPLEAATVFIAGMTKKTLSDSDGKFNLGRFVAGTYQLSVSMLGYEKLKYDVLITDGTVFLNLKLNPQNILLNEVAIFANSTQRKKNLELFKKAFLGSSGNVGKCRILNPEVLSLKMDRERGLLTADCDDFLIIENMALGYKVSYLLNSFSYDTKKDIALYNGDIVFEELSGIAGQLKIWKQARLKTYRGSLMHFFRSVYRKEAAAEGFEIHQAFEDVPKFSGWGFGKYVVEIDRQQLELEEKNAPHPQGLLPLHFVKILVRFYSEGLNQKARMIQPTGREETIVGEGSSVIYLLKKGLKIDAKGDFSDHQSLFIHGAFARQRLADQLPYEYMP